jgi:hypothetical protein
MNAGSGSRVKALPVSHSRRAFAIYKPKSVALEAYYVIETAHRALYLVLTESDKLNARAHFLCPRDCFRKLLFVPYFNHCP